MHPGYRKLAAPGPHLSDYRLFIRPWGTGSELLTIPTELIYLSTSDLRLTLKGDGLWFFDNSKYPMKSCHRRRRWRLGRIPFHPAARWSEVQRIAPLRRR